MIKVENLHKYFGDLEVLKGVNAKIDKSEVVCVIGPSGSGKSTFLRCLNLLEVPTARFCPLLWYQPFLCLEKRFPARAFEMRYCTMKIIWPMHYWEEILRRMNR